MIKILQLKLKARPLFFKLFLGFLLVIGLLLSFNFFSFNFYKGNIRDQIIQYNTRNLLNTTDSFEKHFQLVSSLLLTDYINEESSFANEARIDYSRANKLIQELAGLTSNPLLFLNDLLLYHAGSDFILEKTRGADAKTYFSELFHNDLYTYDFWMKEFDKSFGYRIYPAASFANISHGHTSERSGVVFPMVVKSKMYPDIKLIAMLDAQKLFRAFHNSINDNFFILDPEGNLLFSSAETTFGLVSGLHSGEAGSMGAVRRDNHFYFFSKGSITGLTYVNIVPDAAISSQVVRLNLTLILFLAVSLVIAVAVSLLLSMHFNNPVRKIVESIRKLNPPADGNPMNEFDFIRAHLERVKSDNKAFHEDLEEKNSLLRSYLYVNKLKKIHLAVKENADPQSSPIEGPYLFVLFHVTFKDKFGAELGDQEERAVYFFREFISRAVSGAFPDSQTFQPEAKQILSLIFTEDRNKVLDELEKVGKMLRLDHEYCFLTIAVSSSYSQASEFTAAYEEALELLEQRPFDDQTRILTESGAKEYWDALPPALEQEFDVNLPAGNEAELAAAAQKMLAHLLKKDAAASQIRRFTDFLAQKILRLLRSLNLDTRELQAQYYDGKPWEQLHTADQLEAFFGSMIREACAMVRRKKEERDHIVGFVMDYVEANHAGDITLDLVAEKLNISGGYLSTYFKEKTGVNFLDYVNEVRVKKAKVLLEDTDMKIQDIAVKAGYQNMNSFNRMFKKFSGVTPSEYRRSKHQV